MGPNLIARAANHSGGSTNFFRDFFDAEPNAVNAYVPSEEPVLPLSYPIPMIGKSHETANILVARHDCNR